MYTKNQFMIYFALGIFLVGGGLFFFYKANEISYPTIVGLEEEVEEILSKESSVITRKYIAKIYQLANLYSKEGRIDEAIKLYRTALTVNSLDFHIQYDLAKLLKDSGKENEATDIFKYAYKYLEDSEALNEVEEVLRDLNYEFPVSEKSKNLHERFEIVLVPVGNPNKIILSELGKELEKVLGISVVFSEKTVPLATFDRDLYVQERLKAENRLNLRILLQSKEEKRKIKDEFKKSWDYYGRQYNADKVLKGVKHSIGWNPKKMIRVYLGVTEQDIFSEDSRFLFGTSQDRFGLMSYKRFTAKYNGEFENRVRLIDRMIKQAMSTVNFSLGIERCHNPYCVRAYPHNLQEHDAKSVELCDLCSKKLEELKDHPENFRYKRWAWEK